MTKALGYAAKHSFSRLKALEIERDPPRANEVQIDILYCGVCHSDIHQVENDWGNTVYPCMPGHEIVGRVTACGDGVSRHKVGDLVGVGCMIDSCRTCKPCREGDEHHCEGPNSWLATYNGPMTPPAATDGKNMYGRDNTFGGYSTLIVVPEDFVLSIPDGLPIEAAAPILCAGVTTFSPLKHWGVKAGDRVGIVGLGGLGHMAVKLAVALGAGVTVFTSDKDKVEAAKALGASQVVIEGDKDAFSDLSLTFDFILSTIPEKHKVDPYIALLKRNATYCAVGALDQMPGYNNQELIMHRRSLAGSLIGSIAETQAVLDFCAEHGVAPDIEIIDIQDVNDAYKKVKNEDVRFRYVIDMASLKHEMEDAS